MNINKKLQFLFSDNMSMCSLVALAGSRGTNCRIFFIVWYGVVWPALVSSRAEGVRIAQLYMEAGEESENTVSRKQDDRIGEVRERMLYQCRWGIVFTGLLSHLLS